MADTGDMRQGGTGPEAGASAPRLFFVATDTGVADGPYPSFDIARMVAEHRTYLAVEADAQGALAVAYAKRLKHARRYFAGQTGRWLQADMPSRRAMACAPELDAIEPRILRRNSAALAHYLEGQPDGSLHPLYEQLAWRYLKAVHGVETKRPGGGVRAFMEVFHHSNALRQLAQSGAGRASARHFQPLCPTEAPAPATDVVLRVTRQEAAAMLRRHATFYRGFDHDLPRHNFTPRVRGKWDRFCAGAVILPGVDRGELFEAAAQVLAQAHIDHGIDASDNAVPMRCMLLHLTQWCLVSERNST